MKNFKFYNPTKIIFGEGTIKEIAGEIPREARVLLTYGGGSIKRNGLIIDKNFLFVSWSIFSRLLYVKKIWTTRYRRWMI